MTNNAVPFLVRILKLVVIVFDALAFPFLVVASIVFRRGRRVLVWGPVPTINNKYWSQAMQRAGWKSVTLMASYYPSINKREDYDLYFEDLFWFSSFPFLSRVLGPYLAHLYIIRNAQVVHIPFSGGALGNTNLWRTEAWLYRLANIRTVVLPYGSDIYMYSKIFDPTVRNALLLSYPDSAKREFMVERKIRYWTSHADVIVMGFTMDGIGRWDVPSGNMLCIDVDEWAAPSKVIDRSGVNTVRVLHAPNHRGVKGTEFIVDAVEKLRAEGVNIELVLAEKISNEKIKRLMQDVHLLADQLILPGYGLNAIEGMASGLPVIANLDDPTATMIFRRYAFLNECPIVSATPETFLEVLRILSANPKLRIELGTAGRAYVEKYHSYETAQYLFGSIYRKFAGEEVDLMNLYHPLKSSYCGSRATVRHPLVDNKIPRDYCENPCKPR